MVEFFNSIETQLLKDVVGGRGTSSWGDAQGGSYLELQIGTFKNFKTWSLNRLMKYITFLASLENIV